MRITSDLRRHGLAAALMALLCLTATARAELVTIEQAFETDNSVVSLPDRANQSVSLPGCGTTCPNSVKVTAETRYFVKQRVVTLAELRTHLARGRVQFTLFYDPKTLVLNRVVAY